LRKEIKKLLGYEDKPKELPYRSGRIKKTGKNTWHRTAIFFGDAPLLNRRKKPWAKTWGKRTRVKKLGRKNTRRGGGPQKIKPQMGGKYPLKIGTQSPEAKKKKRGA